MELTQLHCGRRDTDQAQPDSEALSELLDVMEELSEVLTVENDFLHRGLPATLSEVAERKSQLSDAYMEVCDDVLAEHAGELSSNPQMLERLTTTGAELHCLTRENMASLETALAATQRRIDAVMAAVLACDAPDDVALGHFVDYEAGFKV